MYNHNNILTDCITGEKFISLANGVDVFYRHTHDVNDFFWSRECQKDKKFILISHNSDGYIGKPPSRRDCANVNLIPDNLIHWFGQNVNIVNERIESIPIGLENDKWFLGVRKKEKMLLKLKEEKTFKNLLYINHNPRTNPEKREGIYEMFSQKCKCWVTIEIGINGVNFDSYLNNIYNHKFVICPEGNGIDTHRTWECLYMGTIPIEKKNINNQFYTDLPILFVNDWEEITEELLVKEYQRIKKTKWNLDKLSFDYWKNRINGN